MNNQTFIVRKISKGILIFSKERSPAGVTQALAAYRM